MAEIKTIYKGESVTLLFTFPEVYDMARLASHKVFVGETEFAGVIEGQAIKMQLKSSDTDRMIGTHRIVCLIDDTTLGLRKPYCGELVIAKTQASGSTASVSNISDIIIPIVISETAITVGDVMYNYVKGDKGDPFTYSDFTPEQLESLKVKGDPFTYEDFTPEQLEALKSDVTANIENLIANILLNYQAVTQLGSALGISPDNPARINVSLINSALDRGNLYIDVVGTYDLDDTLYVPSNRVLKFAEGVKLRKATGSSFVYVIANKGILTNSLNTNIRIYGVDIDVNGIDSGAIAIEGMRANFAFYKVDDFLIDGLKIYSQMAVSNQFMSQFAEVTNGIIRNVDISGWKDSMHFGVADNILIEDVVTASGDDGIALNAWDYIQSNPTFGDIKNITIRRWTDNAYPLQSGMGVLTLTGSFKNWEAGSSYEQNRAVIANGRVYQKTTLGGVSTVEPSHLSGIIVGADGVGWKMKHGSPITNCSIYNITVEDVTWNSNRSLFGTRADEPCVTPDTFLNATVDNITFNNITIGDVSPEFMAIIDTHYGDLVIKNTIHNSWTKGIYLQDGGNGAALDSITFDNCQITIPTDKFLLYTITKPVNYYSLGNFKLINGSIITWTGSNRTYMVNSRLIEITDSTLKGVNRIGIEGVNNSVTNIIATRAKFLQSCRRLIFNYQSTGCTFNFTSIDCEFEETTLAMFENEVATSTINVITTGSTGEDIPYLKKGNYVDVTNCDLVSQLGDNVCRNGKFLEDVSAWWPNVKLTWDNGCAKLICAAPTSVSAITQDIKNPLSNYVRLTFKAKSPTLTGTMRSPYNPNTLTPIQNPTLTTEWQTYIFEGDRGAATGLLYIALTATNNPEGSIIYFDDVTVVQY